MPVNCRCGESRAASASARSAATRKRRWVIDWRRPRLAATSARSDLGMRVQPVADLARLARQRLGRPGRHDQQLRPGSCRGRRATVVAGGSSSTTWAFVPPTPNELTPARRGPSPTRPRARGVVDVERAALEVDRRVGPAEVAALGGSVRAVQRQHRLDQAGDAGGRVEVADVGLDRAERAEAAVRRCRAGTPASAPRPRSGRRAACRCRGPRRSRSCRASTPATASASATTSA